VRAALCPLHLPALGGAALRKAVMAIWCVCFCGMQWRAIGQPAYQPMNWLRVFEGRRIWL